MTEQHSDIKVIDEFGREAGHIPARHRAIYLLPNAFTTAALFAGFFAIVKAMNHEFNVAAVSIFCAMVLDGMDGRVARLTKTKVHLASSTTVWPIWFHLASPLPWSYMNGSCTGWGRAFGADRCLYFTVCAALRLARFNINTDVIDKRYFQGLPAHRRRHSRRGWFGWLRKRSFHSGGDHSLHCHRHHSVCRSVHDYQYSLFERKSHGFAALRAVRQAADVRWYHALYHRMATVCIVWLVRCLRAVGLYHVAVALVQRRVAEKQRKS